MLASSPATPVKKPCVFCDIIAGKESAKIEHEWPDALAIHTNRPKAPGHLLVIPKKHIQDANEDPDLAAKVLKRAAEIAKPPSHIHTNIGGAAAQTVFHLHFHVLPRTPNQEVKLSWFSGWSESPHDRKPLKVKIIEKFGLRFNTEMTFGKTRISSNHEFHITGPEKSGDGNDDNRRSF